MTRFPLAVVLAALAISGPAFANADLAAAKQCMQCHKMKEDFAAPSFHKIALKYKGERNGVVKITNIIRLGSEGTGGPHWGPAKMPDMKERPEVSKAEAHQLANWILKQ